MSLLSLILGMPSLGSANNVLGNDGLSARMGGSPFSLGDNPFAGLRQHFPDAPWPQNEEQPDPGPKFGGPEVQPSMTDSPMWHRPFELQMNAPEPSAPEFKPMGFSLRTNKGNVTGSQGSGGPVPSNQNSDAPIKPQNDNLPGPKLIQTAFDPSTGRPTGGDEVDQALAEQGIYPGTPAYEAYRQAVPKQIGSAAPASPAGAQTQKTPTGTAPVQPSAQADPGAGGAGMLDVYINHVIQAESGGDPNAKNPLSSALGLGQFTKGTWADLMARHPELHLTPDGRTDPTQAKAALRVFSLENAGYLKGQGIPITPGSLYAAHFLGKGGAQSVYHAPDGARLMDLIDPAQAAANPFLRGMTVGGFKQWAERKMVGKVSNQYPGTGDASVAEAMQPALGPRAESFDLASDRARSPIPGDLPGKGSKGGGLEMGKAQDSAPASADPTRSHADRLAILRQFMQISGFTPEEMA